MAKKNNDIRIYREIERRQKANKNNLVAIGGDSKSTASAKERRRNMRQPVEGSIMWAVILVLFIIYVGGYTHYYLTREQLSETKIVFGSIDSPIINTGIIVRDESIYKSEADGMTVYGVQDLSRVKKGDIICSVEDAERVLELEQQIQNVNTSIMGIQSGREDLSIFSNDIQKSNQQIKTIIDNASFRQSTQDIRNVYDLAERIQTNLDFRNKMLLSENRGSLRSHTTYKDSLLNQLSGAKHNVYTDESGIFSTYVDGYEDIFTVDEMEALSKEKTLIETDYTNLAYNRNVAKNSPIFKVVKSNVWYIVAYVPTHLVSGWTENSTRTIYVEKDNGFTSLEVIVHKVEKISAEDTERFIILRSSRHMMDFISMRNIRFKIDLGVREGLKIPITSIADKTLLKIPIECVFTSNSRRLVIKREPSTRGGSGFIETQIPITITHTDDEYAYIIQDYNQLALGDTLVISGSGAETHQIAEIENVKGIYIINSGSAVFYKIVIDNYSSSNSEYIILNPASNPRLKVHDRVVLDIRQISINQMVY